MLNKQELLACIVRKGLTQEQVAKEIGITPKTFYNKLKKGVLGSDEIEKLINLLEIENPMVVFFANAVT